MDDHSTASVRTFARWRNLFWGLAATSLVSAAILASGLLSEKAAFDFSSITYAFIPAAAGLGMLLAASVLRGRERLAWVAIGAGVLAWGLGETIWVLYEYVWQTEVPYPGWADGFYVAGYPLLFVGILLLPHVKGRRLERVRLTMDATAGSIAVAAVMWVTYLSDQIHIDSEVGFLEQFVNIMYPLGDVFLLVAVMILATRRSARRFDLRLLAIATSLIFALVADYFYILQVEAETYVSGGLLDSMWLIQYALVAVAAVYLLMPHVEREQADRSVRSWQLVAPYSAVAMLFGLTLWRVGGEGSVLEIATGLVALLVIGRQGVAIRENRELVEQQRNDLIASISHELRTPMTSVSGFTEILEHEWDSLDASERAEVVSIVNRQAQHVNRIVTDLVGLARDDLDFADLRIEPYELAVLIDDAETMLLERFSEIAAMETDLEPDLWVEVDPQRLTQVIVNVLTNAVRYGNGKVHVRSYRRTGAVILEVHDDGPGVPKRYEETIWERFERGAHRLNSLVPGSGVGLPIARALVEAHGGKISHRPSELLGGACFVVLLPQAIDPHAVATPESVVAAAAP
jgi:signal transduction histidine kinase